MDRPDHGGKNHSADASRLIECRKNSGADYRSRRPPILFLLAQTIVAADKLRCVTTMPVYGPCGAQPTACRGGTAVRRRSAAKSTAAGCGAAAEGIRLSLAIASQLMRHSHTVAWRPVGFISEYASAAAE